MGGKPRTKTLEDYLGTKPEPQELSLRISCIGQDLVKIDTDNNAREFLRAGNISALMDMAEWLQGRDGVTTVFETFPEFKTL